jgi:hypothetical protein
MNAIAAAGGGFLLAVLWFDLMFDVQTRGHAGAVLPANVLASISAYYRRVTTDASPMSGLIVAVMAVTLLALAAEIRQGAILRWIAWTSLAAALAGIGLALLRTVPNAVRLGRATETPQVQTHLARTIYRDHLFSFAAMIVVIALQLAAQLLP